MTLPWLSCSLRRGQSNALRSKRPALEDGEQDEPANCAICHRGFKRLRAAELHILEHYGWVACSACGETMPDREFKRHRERRHIGRQFGCHCGASFATAGRLERHARETHEGPWYGCSKCLRICRSWEAFLEHRSSSRCVVRNSLYKLESSSACSKVASTNDRSTECAKSAASPGSGGRDLVGVMPDKSEAPTRSK
jgi:hypothetical protein